MCRASQGARGLKLRRVVSYPNERGRASQGARGLKLSASGDTLQYNCRASQGARGLKHERVTVTARRRSRASQGARGLKLHTERSIFYRFDVAPRRGRVD